MKPLSAPIRALGSAEDPHRWLLPPADLPGVLSLIGRTPLVELTALAGPPRARLLAKLESLTNLRVVRDQESETGWTLTHDPFPGWETVPTW